jgi:predicted nucleotidyltransferase
MGVMASGWCNIAQVCHKILVAFLTMMLRIGNLKFDRSSRDQIANIMQLALVYMLSSGGLPAQRARAVRLIAVFFDHLCFGQIFDPLIFNIRLILAWTVSFGWLFGRGWRFHPASLLQNTRFGCTCVDRPATVSFFGSVLRDDFKPTSDVDILVEFKKGYTPGLAFFAMPEELKRILGREVDLLTYQGVKTSRNPIRRKAILDSAKVFYVAR